MNYLIFPISKFWSSVTTNFQLDFKTDSQSEETFLIDRSKQPQLEKLKLHKFQDSLNLFFSLDNRGWPQLKHLNLKNHRSISIESEILGFQSMCEFNFPQLQYIRLGNCQIIEEGFRLNKKAFRSFTKAKWEKLKFLLICKHSLKKMNVLCQLSKLVQSLNAI